MFVIAHRSNSVAAVARYAEAGFTHFELDVRLTAGRVVLGHFQKVMATRGVLERNNAKLRVASGPPYDVPIEKVLTVLPFGAVLLFDPKDREPALRARLATLLAGIVDDPARHVVSSRSVEDLRAFRAAGFRTWWTLDRPEQLRRIADAAGTTGALPADGVTVRQRALTEDAIRMLHEVTDTVTAWTVNRAPRALELAADGVDGITTDALAVAAVLNGRRPS